MNLSAIFGKRELSPEDAEKEALLAFNFMQKAEEAVSLTDAVPHLKDFSKLVRRSHQKEIYEPDDIQPIIGEQLFKAISDEHPDHFNVRTFNGRLRIVSPNEDCPPIEEMVQNKLFIHGEVANGLMDEQKVSQYVQKRASEAKAEMEKAYDEIFGRLAFLAHQHRSDYVFPMEAIVDDYEANLEASRRTLENFQIPSLTFKEEEEPKSATTIVYTAALNQLLLQSRYYLKRTETSEEMSDETLRVASKHFEERLKQGEKYLRYCEFDEEAISEFKKQIIGYLQKREELLPKIIPAIESRHDDLYDTVNEEEDVKKKVDAFRELLSLSLSHSQVLEVNVSDMIKHGENAFEKVGADLVWDDNQLVIEHQEETYTTGISRS